MYWIIFSKGRRRIGTHDHTKSQTDRKHESPQKKIPRNPGEAQLGITHAIIEREKHMIAVNENINALCKSWFVSIVLTMHHNMKEVNLLFTIVHPMKKSYQLVMIFLIKISWTQSQSQHLTMQLRTKFNTFVTINSIQTDKKAAERRFWFWITNIKSKTGHSSKPFQHYYIDRVNK